MPNISFRNTSGIKMHYVSFNFGRDLGELHSLLTVLFNSCVVQDLCPGLIRVVLYRSFHSHGHMAAMTSFENHLLFKSFHIATA